MPVFARADACAATTPCLQTASCATLPLPLQLKAPADIRAPLGAVARLLAIAQHGALLTGRCDALVLAAAAACAHTAPLHAHSTCAYTCAPSHFCALGCVLTIGCMGVVSAPAAPLSASSSSPRMIMMCRRAGFCVVGRRLPLPLLVCPSAPHGVGCRIYVVIYDTVLLVLSLAGSSSLKV